jgi:hypothetical protein
MYFGAAFVGAIVFFVIGLIIGKMSSPSSRR